MKKNILVCALFFVLFSTGAMAQQVRFGIRAGVSEAAWRGDVTESTNALIDLTSGYAERQARTGFHAGVYAAIPLSAQFTFEPGIQYSQKGTVLKGDFSNDAIGILNARATVTNRASYIDVPLLAKFYVTEGFLIFAGPQVSFLVANQVNTRASVLGFSLLNRDFDATSNFRRVDVGLTGGLGYRFSNGLNFSLGYDHGLSTLDPNGNINGYNRVVKASVGFEF
jgi:hypothetical protein